MNIISKPETRHTPSPVIEGRRIRFGKLTLTLSVEEISSINPHEQILPGLVNRLVFRMLRDHTQLDPVIIDLKTKVALDGMHRIEALRRIGCSLVLVCALDYCDESVGVARWLRCLEESGGDLLDGLEKAMQLKKVEGITQAVQAVNSLRSPIALLTKKCCYISKLDFTSTYIAYNMVRRFDEEVHHQGYSFRTEPDSKSPEQLVNNYSAVLFPSPISKNKVLEIGQSRKLLPPKSSRHIIPYKPTGFRYPIKWLRDAGMMKSSRNNLDLFLKQTDLKFSKPRGDLAT